MVNYTSVFKAKVSNSATSVLGQDAVGYLTNEVAKPYYSFPKHTATTGCLM